MKPEHIAIGVVALVAFFAVAKPMLDKSKAEADKRALDKRAAEDAVAKKEATTNALVGFGTMMTSGGKLAEASANVMGKISEMLG